MSPLTIKKIYFLNSVFLLLIIIYSTYEILTYVLLYKFDESVFEGFIYYGFITLLAILNVKKLRFSIILSALFMLYNSQHLFQTTCQHLNYIYQSYQHKSAAFLLSSWTPDLTQATLAGLQIGFGISVTLCALYQFLFKNRKLMSVAI